MDGVDERSMVARTSHILQFFGWLLSGTTNCVEHATQMARSSDVVDIIKWTVVMGCDV